MFKWIAGLFFLAIVMATAKGMTSFSKREEAKLERAAQNAELSKTETAALKVCAADLAGKTFDVRLPTGKTINTGISRDVCTCQARAMARLFKDNRYAGHGRILAYMAGTGPAPKLDPADFRKPGTPPKEILDDVSDSLMDCTLKMRADRIESARAKRYREREDLDD